MRHLLGISFQFGPELSVQLCDSVMESCFDAIQVQDSSLNSFDFPASLTLHITDICPSSTSQIVSDQPKILKGFVDQISKRISDPSYLPVKSLSLDIGIDFSTENREMYDARIELIKKVSVLAFANNIRIDLPLRMPFILDDIAQFHIKFLKEAISPSVALSIDIHPHELSRDFSVEQLMRWSKFDIGTIRFIYEPEAGNRIVKQHILPWIKFLSKNGYKGEIFFAPVISNEEFFLTEIVDLKALIDSLN